MTNTTAPPAVDGSVDTMESAAALASMRAPLDDRAILYDASASGREGITAALHRAGLRIVGTPEGGAGEMPLVVCVTLIGNGALGAQPPSRGLDRALLRSAADGMVKRGIGRMVLITDLSPGCPLTGDPDVAAMLGADLIWWQELAARVAVHGVTANTIALGYTPAVGHLLERSRIATLMRYQPIRRQTEVADIADAVRMLCSGGCSYLVGETIRVDGGAALHLTPPIEGIGSGTGTTGALALSSVAARPADYRDLAGRCVLVTGASSGIGRATALHVAERGADVVLVARRQDALDDVAHAIQALGRNAWTVPCDLARTESADQLPDLAWRAAGRIDALVYAAGHLGFAGPGDSHSRQVTFAVNLFSYMAIAEPLVTRWVENNVAGAIATVASVSNTSVPVARLENYGPSKAAMTQHVRALAVSAGRYGIRLNAVAPGIIETTMGEAAGPSQRNGWLSRIPAGRLGQAHEVAAVVGHLISPAASHTTGASPRIDGGFGLGYIAGESTGVGTGAGSERS